MTVRATVGRSGGAMSAKKKRQKAKKKTRWMNIIALILMLSAIFGYLATLDESDPEALPIAEGAMNNEAP